MQSGRSMVEMLGVLAIIGVLSVGGIAGYTKAMQTYRLNTFRRQLNQIINTVIELRPHFDKKVYLKQQTYVLEAFDAIPDGMTYMGGIYDRLKDANGIYYFLYYGLIQNKPECRLLIMLPKQDSISMSNKEYCVNIALVAQRLKNDIQAIFAYPSGGWLSYTSSLPNIDKQCSRFCPEDMDTADCRLFIYIKP